MIKDKIYYMDLHAIKFYKDYDCCLAELNGDVAYYVYGEPVQQQPNIIYLDGSYEKYIQDNPDDLFPHGGWILSKD